MFSSPRLFSSLLPFTPVSEVTVHSFTEIFHRPPPSSYIRWLREVESEQGERGASVCFHSVLQGPWDHFRTLSSLKWPLTRWENWPLMTLLCGELAQGRRVRGWTEVWVEETGDLSVFELSVLWMVKKKKLVMELYMNFCDTFITFDGHWRKLKCFHQINQWISAGGSWPKNASWVCFGKMLLTNHMSMHSIWQNNK